MIAESLEEVNDIAVDVVIRLYSGRLTVKQNGPRTREWLAIMMDVRE